MTVGDDEISDDSVDQAEDDRDDPAFESGSRCLPSDRSRLVVRVSRWDRIRLLVDVRIVVDRDRPHRLHGLDPLDSLYGWFSLAIGLTGRLEGLDPRVLEQGVVVGAPGEVVVHQFCLPVPPESRSSPCSVFSQ